MFMSFFFSFGYLTCILTPQEKQGKKKIRPGDFSLWEPDFYLFILICRESSGTGVTEDNEW